MGPPAAFAGGVGIAFFIAELVMDAVGGHPEDRSTFEGEGAADGEEVLEPERDSVGAMGVQAMVTHADSQTRGYPVQEHGGGESAPVLRRRGGRTGVL